MSNGPLYAFGGAHPNALDRNKDAMTGLATGKKTERPQDILTPQVVVDFLEALWDLPIAMDPCASRDPRSIVRTSSTVDVFEDPNNPLGGGLLIPWPDCTYVNPPFKHLKHWLAKAGIEAGSDNAPGIAMLAPTRGHREWWHEARDTCSVAIELHAKFTFVGYDQAFPAPLSLLLRNEPDTVTAALDKSGLRFTKVAYL